MTGRVALGEPGALYANVTFLPHKRVISTYLRNSISLYCNLCLSRPGPRTVRKEADFPQVQTSPFKDNFIERWVTASQS